METTLLVPIIVGLVEAVKRVGLPTRFLPLLSVVLGIASHWVIADVSIITGLIYGLGGVGLYSSVKNTAGI